MINNLATPINQLPSQMISYREKVKDKKKWGKECLDVFDNIARSFIRENWRLKENYEMLNGKFMAHHYYDNGEIKDMMSLLTKEFDLPSTLRHYDIIGKLVNNLTEKLQEFPDVFRVEEQYEEDETNEYVRTKTELLHQSIRAEINREIAARLANQGIDIYRQDFASEEEAMQFYTEVQKMQQAMTPRQIEDYMKTEWQGQGERWGQHQLTLDKQRFNLPDMEREEFGDMLRVDRCFRHFYISSDGYYQETWNPLEVFLKTDKWVQDGSYVGRQRIFSKADLIDRFGWKLKAKDIKKIQEVDKNWRTGDVDMNGFPKKAYVPFEDYRAFDIITRASGYDPINKVPLLPEDDLLYASGNSSPINRLNSMYRVTEVYWKSQKKIGKAVFIDEDTGLITQELVDENFVVPSDWDEITGDFKEGDEVNTVYWTWINEVWQGTKISLPVSESEDIYLDIKPCEFQFKGDYNPFGCRLPVCGRIFNDRNAQSMSFVDYTKPHQIGYNVCMNQLYQIIEKEQGKMTVWDANFFNTMKDWGGEESWEKIAIIGRELGHIFGDTSPESLQGANPGNQLPKILDMEETARMFSRAKLADFFEARLMSQVGVSPQFVADVKATETATGIDTAVTQTQLNVQKYYTDFFEYKRQCLTMDLDIAQYVQSNKKDATVMYTKSDGSREFIKLAGMELLLRNMHVYIVNSQELLKQLEIIKNLFVNNNTTNASALDLVEIITSYSPSAIKAKLEAAMEKQQLREDQIMQQQQAMQDKEIQSEMEKEQIETQRNTQDNQTKENVAWITATAKQPTATVNPPVQDFNKIAIQQSNEANRSSEQREKNDLSRQKANDDKTIRNRQLDIKEKELKTKEKISQNALKQAVKNKNRYDK